MHGAHRNTLKDPAKRLICGIVNALGTRIDKSNDHVVSISSDKALLTVPHLNFTITIRPKFKPISFSMHLSIREDQGIPANGTRGKINAENRPSQT